jgi:hypothetical protein
MAVPPAAQPTSMTLEKIFGEGFRTTLLAWRETVQDFDTDICIGLNSLADPSKIQTVRDALEGLRRKCWDLRSQIGKVEGTVSSIKDILEVRKAEAEYKTTIVNSWPVDLVAERVSYLGTGVLAAGGAAYALSGYPSVSNALLPTLILWAVGLGLLILGISRLVKNQRDRFDFFRRQFKLEIEGKA